MNQIMLPENVTIRPAELDVRTIIVRERQRQVTPEHVDLLRNSILETGKQIVPIAVSERSNGKLILIDGAHRLEAAKQDSRETIRAEVYSNLTEEQEGILEYVTNRARKDLSPAEILVAWETFDLPLFEMKAKEKQAAAGLNTLVARGQLNESPLMVADHKRGDEPSVTVRQLAVDTTGHGERWLEKVATIRDLAANENAPAAVREVAKRGFEKLKEAGGKVEPVYKEVQKVHAAVLRQAEDPEKLLARDAEDRLDEIVKYTTLLQEKLDGDLRDFLAMAGRKDQMGRDMLRSTRVALVRALTSIVVIECEVSDNAPESLRTIGSEITTLLKEESMKALNLGQEGPGADHV